MYVCKNSEARWSLRNNERKGSQESRGGESVSRLTSPAHPGWTGVLQTHNIPAATSSHHTFPVAVLDGIELEFSSLHNVLEKLFISEEPLISITSSFPAQP